MARIRSLRILFLSGGEVPFPPLTGGGSERQMYDLARELSNKGHRVLILDRRHVGLSRADELVKRLSIPKVNWTAREGIISELLNQFTFGIAAALYVTRARREIDLVQIHGVISGACVSLVTRLLGMRVSYRCDNPQWSLSQKEPLQTRLMMLAEKLVMYSCKNVMVHCDEMKASLVRRTSIRQELISVVSIGVDTDQFRPGLPLTDPLKWLGLCPFNFILFAGRITREKGIDIFVRAIPLIDPGKLPNVRFVVAGPKSKRVSSDVPSAYFCFLQELARRLNIQDRIIFTGRLPVRDLTSLLSNAMIFAYPSRAEAQPGIVIEAMSSGVPVIGSMAAGIPSAVSDGVCGRIGQDWSPETFASLIIEVGSSAARGAYSRNARKRAVEVFDWKVVADRFLEMSEDIVEGNTQN